MSRIGPNSLYRIAYDYLNTHGKDLKGESLAKTFLHGIGHRVGLSVHDVGHNTRRLEAGMVITVEPACIFPKRTSAWLRKMECGCCRKPCPRRRPKSTA